MVSSGGNRRPFSHWPAVIPESAAASVGEHEEKRRSLLHELPLLLLVAFLIAFGVKSVVAQAFFIPSESMEATLKVGDRVLVSRLSYRMHDPRRGDVVVFTSPYENGKDDRNLPVRVIHGILESVGLRQPSTEDFIKRVIGLPGETVEGKNGKVYIDGRELVEPYLNEETIPGFEPKKVPEGKLWVMGDNRNQSQDARVFGPIDKDKLIGRAILRIWPIPRIGFL